MRVHSLASATVVVLTSTSALAAQERQQFPLPSSATIKGWYMQSSEHVSQDMTELSRPGVDVSSWFRVSSHCTVMGGLLENNVYNETSLFFSDNLATMVNQSQFSVPWLFREELALNLQPQQHIFLQTNGISSKADLYVNGVLVTSKDSLKGAYGGQKVDITEHIAKGKITILIRAYPTNYLADFALGFVDWNPYPADNGTGVWRAVQLFQTGPVSLLKPRVITDYIGKDTNKVTVTVKVVVRNNGLRSVQGKLSGVIKEIDGQRSIAFSEPYNLKAGEAKTLSMAAYIQQPKIWWPRLWGSQPLYTLDLTAYVGSSMLSDSTQRTFGIRHVTSAVNSHNDTAFTVNGHSFLVLGAGYSSDMFLRFDEVKLAAQFSLMLDMGMNTVRLEGKQEHPALYDIADRMGLLVLAGWECCDKWEGWPYNNDGGGVKWVEDDYDTANKQMEHEAYMMQGHPSMLGFLIGSDFWPDDRASKIYVDKLRELDWDVPIIASAAKRGYPEILGPSGMKMDGPYDWVSPNYWYGDQLGAAFGFGSELGSGVGTPELSSLKRFLSKADLDDLWTAPSKGLYHMSTSVSQFFDRSIYNSALYARYGHPTSLTDYLLKAQAMDYEATRAQYEAYSIRKNADRPATGIIYWMLNNAWPSLHWNLFDYYLKPAGSYFGAKVGSRPEHVVFEYGSSTGNIWLVNHFVGKQNAAPERTIEIEILSVEGKILASKRIAATTRPNYSQLVGSIPEATTLKAVAFLRLVLRNSQGAVLSRNVYWLSKTLDVNDWENSEWYYTPVETYANYTSLQSLRSASLVARAIRPVWSAPGGRTRAEIELKNDAKVPAYLVRLELQDASGRDILPAFWEDNYITLWPGEKISIGVEWKAANPVAEKVINISGMNIARGLSLRLK